MFYGILGKHKSQVYVRRDGNFLAKALKVFVQEGIILWKFLGCILDLEQNDFFRMCADIKNASWKWAMQKISEFFALLFIFSFSASLAIFILYYSFQNLKFVKNKHQKSLRVFFGLDVDDIFCGIRFRATNKLKSIIEKMKQNICLAQIVLHNM